MLWERRRTCASFCGDAGERYPRQSLAGRWRHGFPLANKFRRHVRPSRAKPNGEFQRSGSPGRGTRWICLGRAGARRKGRRATATRASNVETVHHSGVRWQFDRGHSVAGRPRQVSLGRNANEGIYRIRGNKVDHFRGSDGLSGDAVSNIFQDREGNIWIATSRGIDNLHDIRVVSFSTRQGLSSDQVDSVLASRDGTVWIGNYSLDILRSGKVTSIQPRNGLPGREMTSLLEDRDGRLWVGTDEELSVYERGKFTKIHTRDGSPLGTVRAMAEDVDGSIWAATSGHSAENRNRLLRI